MSTEPTCSPSVNAPMNSARSKMTPIHPPTAVGGSNTPTTVGCMRSDAVTTVISSPTDTPPASIAEVFIITSPASPGARPSRISKDASTTSSSA